MPFRLSVEDGRFARTLEVCAGEIVVGTAEGCGLRLVSEGVAPRHARFRQQGRSVLVEDLGSAGGVHLRGERRARLTLRVGDAVRVGGAQLQLVEVRPRGPDDPVPPPRAPRARRSARRGTVVAASVALHAAVAAALWSWVLFHGAPRAEIARVQTTFAFTAPELSEPVRVPLVDPVEILPRDRDVELLPTEEETPEDPSPVAPPVEPPPAPPSPAPTPSDVPPPPTPLPVAAAATIGIGATDLPADVAGRSFGKSEAASANRAASGLLGEDAGAAAALRRARAGASPESVWVVRGAYDSAERVLETLGIRHELLGADDPETREVPGRVRVLFYNCNGRPLSIETQRRIARWVWDGGWLVSTDWGVEGLLEKGLEGTLVPLRRGGRGVVSRDETVSVRATTDRGFAAGIAPRDAQGRWWLEDASVPFTIAPGLDAQVLVRSDDLERRHGHDASGVAVTFAYGRGRVLHLLGHVYQQEGDVRGAVLVQRLVVNFVAAALDAR